MQSRRVCVNIRHPTRQRSACCCSSSSLSPLSARLCWWHLHAPAWWPFALVQGISFSKSEACNTHTRIRRLIRASAVAFCPFSSPLLLSHVLSALPSLTCCPSSLTMGTFHALSARVSSGPAASYSTQQQASRVEQPSAPLRLLAALSLACVPLLLRCGDRLPVAKPTHPGQCGQPSVCLQRAHRGQEQQRRKDVVTLPFSAGLFLSAVLPCLRSPHSNAALSATRPSGAHRSRVAVTLSCRRSRQSGALTSARRHCAFPASLASRCRLLSLLCLCASGVPAVLYHSVGLPTPPGAHTPRAYRRQQAKASERHRRSSFLPSLRLCSPLRALCCTYDHQRLSANASVCVLCSAQAW